MRRSSIEVRRQSKTKTLNYPAGSQLDLSFDGFSKTNLGKRIILRRADSGITQIGVSTLQESKSSTSVQNSQIFDNQAKIDNSSKLPQYEFLKNKQLIKDDPFLKAKMKYLLGKQKPNLTSQIPKVNALLNDKKNTQKIVNQQNKQYTTLKSQNQKEKSKKLSLLVNANSNPPQPQQ